MESIDETTKIINELERLHTKLREKSIFELPRNLQKVTVKRENKSKYNQTIQQLILYLRLIEGQNINLEEKKVILDTVELFAKNNFGL